MTYPKPFSYADLDAIRREMLGTARLTGYAPEVVQATLDTFIQRLTDGMWESGTVFYQP